MADFPAKKFADLFGIARRSEDDDIKSIHMDLAASVQAVIEEVIINLAKSVKKDTDLDNLCMAGGVALNCVANSRLYKEKIFKNIWVQPAAGDAGGALGAAQYLYYHILENKRHVNEIDDQMQGAFLGNQYNSNEIINDDGCVICMDENSTEILVPCGHLCMCKSCCESLLKSRSNCPICRREVQSVVS